MNAAKSPVRPELAGFDFASSKPDQPLVKQWATLTFTEAGQKSCEQERKQEMKGKESPPDEPFLN